MRWLAGWPSVGSTCVNSVTGVAACHAASFSTPSRAIAVLRRAARADGTGTVWPAETVPEMFVDGVCDHAGMADASSSSGCERAKDAVHRVEAHGGDREPARGALPAQMDSACAEMVGLYVTVRRALIAGRPGNAPKGQARVTLRRSLPRVDAGAYRSPQGPVT